MDSDIEIIKMNSVVCTLFEGHYHYGVAALANSLYRQGFLGDIYAGFRGELPSWARSAVAGLADGFNNCQTLEVAPGFALHFLSLDTDYHFTNYKPDFMLRLLDGPAKDAEAIYYFDPDIVVTAPWSFFKNWVKCGVSLCEDVNSPISKNHPTRIAWRSYFKEFDINLSFKILFILMGFYRRLFT